MRESIFQTIFNKWLKYNWSKTGAFELKISKNQSLPFNSVKEHQIQALLNVKHRNIAYKIADDSIGYKPFDSFFLKKEDAWVVIFFYNKLGKKKFYMIDVDVWVKEQSISKRKSITEERAAEIGLTCLLDKKNGCTFVGGSRGEGE